VRDRNRTGQHFAVRGGNKTGQHFVVRDENKTGQRFAARGGNRAGRFLTAGFSCAATVVLLITIYRDLPQGESAQRGLLQAVSAGSAVDLDENAASDREQDPDENAASDGERDPDENSASEEDQDPDDVRRVALTFDDGPHPVWTVRLLDGLAERSVQATFFVIGKNIPGNEDIIAQMDQEGHLIGNHTYDHVKISELSVNEACEQVEKTSALVKTITGKDTEYVRPPFGSWCQDLECSFEMFPVLWDVDPLDWTTKNTSDVVRRVLEAVEPDDIILLHDCYESSVEAALLVVDALQEQGYEFVTVDELILE